MRRLGGALLAAALLVSVAACGGNDAGGESNGKIKLTVATFGDFGYKDLYKKYMAANPNIEIVERVTKTEDHHKGLVTHLTTNTGAADIESIEEGWIGQFLNQPAKFNNLLDLGAGDIKTQWPDWKWKRGTAADGTVVGLGTDVGGMAMCYRSDLFEQAGLPTDRAEVSALWPTWEKYFEAGTRFMAAKLPNTFFIESNQVIYRSILGQEPVGIYDGDKVVVETNPGVKKAWDMTIQASTTLGLSAKLETWSQDWNAGFAKGTFATIGCPSWMTTFIQEQAKDHAGKWDIADIPGGSGNWGGSYLTVPKQSKHPKEAYELAKWLTAPDQQAEVFRTKGNFPSTVTLYDQPVIKDFKNPFFKDAPMGAIFAKSVANVVPQNMGPKAGDINTAIINGLTRVEQGKQTPDEAWAQVIKDVNALL